MFMYGNSLYPCTLCSNLKHIEERRRSHIVSYNWELVITVFVIYGVYCTCLEEESILSHTILHFDKKIQSLKHIEEMHRSGIVYYN